MTPLDAARDIDLGPYAGWSEPERVVANIHALYRDFGGRGAIRRADPHGRDGRSWRAERDHARVTRVPSHRRMRGRLDAPATRDAPLAGRQPGWRRARPRR